MCTMHLSVETGVSLPLLAGEYSRRSDNQYLALAMQYSLFLLLLSMVLLVCSARGLLTHMQRSDICLQPSIDRNESLSQAA